jgi:hypothetical protein
LLLAQLRQEFLQRRALMQEQLRRLEEMSADFMVVLGESERARRPSGRR